VDVVDDADVYPCSVSHVQYPRTSHYSLHHSHHYSEFGAEVGTQLVQDLSIQAEDPIELFGCTDLRRRYGRIGLWIGSIRLDRPSCL
jgi:hypothetical protein